jgi:hypothetical protein
VKSKLDTVTGRSHSRGGYVLLMVLVAIIISSVALTRLVSMSSRLSIDAANKHQTLQQKWASKSANRAVLSNASSVFGRRYAELAQSDKPKPPAIIADQIALGTTALSLVVADESAKTNLNALYHASDIRVVEQELQRSLNSTAGRLVSLKPEVESEKRLQKKSARTVAPDGEEEEQEAEIAPAFRSWGQVFNIAGWRKNAGELRDLASITAKVSIWGRGRLNVTRASDEAFLAASRPIVQDGLAKRILESYRDHPERGIKMVLAKEVVNKRDRERLLRMLGEQSDSFSLWSEAVSVHGRLRRYTVIETDQEGLLHTTQFAM